MNINKCDNCGITTYMNPEPEPVYGEKEVEREVHDTVVDKNGKKILKTSKVKEKIKYQKMGKTKKQNPFTGVIEEVEVPLFKDKQPRTVLVNLIIGHEAFQRDFCINCYEKCMKPEVDALINKMAKFRNK